MELAGGVGKETNEKAGVNSVVKETGRHPSLDAVQGERPAVQCTCITALLNREGVVNGSPLDCCGLGR
jgi:hypothetical protein